MSASDYYNWTSLLGARFRKCQHKSTFASHIFDWPFWCRLPQKSPHSLNSHLRAVVHNLGGACRDARIRSRSQSFPRSASHYKQPSWAQWKLSPGRFTHSAPKLALSFHHQCRCANNFRPPTPIQSAALDFPFFPAKHKPSRRLMLEARAGAIH
jgi:hypothetical protein